MTRARPFDLVRGASWAAGLAALGAGLLLVARFAVDAAVVLPHSGVWGYLFGTEWFFRAQRFGALPMIYGTVMVALIALLLATPVALGAAIFTVEALPRRARVVVKAVIELLAGVPSVVYGLLGVLLLRDAIYRLLQPFDPLSGDTLLTAGVLLAVMILPTVTTLADDALAGVPARDRRAARALGLSRAETVLRLVLPRARPGLVAAVLVAMGRALGETIAVFLVIGRQDNQLPDPAWSLAPLMGPGQTLATKLGGSETFLAQGDPLHWGALAGLALILLALGGAATLAGARLVVGSRGAGSRHV